MTRPSSLGVTQALDKGYRIIRQFLIVGGRFGFEFCGLILFEFPHGAPSLLLISFLTFSKVLYMIGIIIVHKVA